MPEIFRSLSTETFSAAVYFQCTAFALLCGVIAALAAFVHGRDDRPTRSFLISLVILPAIVETVVLMVNGNIGTGIAVAGAFSLIRFRSAAGRARDIAHIFLAMTAGIVCATGYVALALAFTAIMAALIVGLSYLPLVGESEYDLRITVPETLNFTDAFDDVLRAYTVSYRVHSVRTSNMGSLYKIHYKVRLRRGAPVKEMIDRLRCRNGNLEISVARAGEEPEAL